MRVVTGDDDMMCHPLFKEHIGSDQTYPHPPRNKTTFQLINTLRQLTVDPKDPIPKEDKAGVVYQIPCSNCPQTYIGQTGRTLGQRLKEHKKAVKDKNIMP